MADLLTVDTPRPRPRLSPEIFHRNLAALETVDATLANGVQAFDPASEGWVVAQTRDNQLSFQRDRPTGGVEWCGRSSLPGVRAQALLEQFDPGFGNVLIPGFAEGSEVAILLPRLGVHRATFVIEQSPVPISLALRLHDLADAIREERLVLLVCPGSEVHAALLDWLRRHPGHLCPERLMMWPWQKLSELAELRSAVESVYRTIHQERQAELSRLAQSGIPPSTTVDAGALGIFALHAREDVWACADGLHTAAQSLGSAVVMSLVRGPGDVHTLARARRLSKQARPSRAILLEVTRHSIRELLDPRTPAVSWISSLSAREPEFTAHLGPDDQLAVTTGRLQKAAVAAGVPIERTHVLPPACPVILEAIDSQRESRAVAVVCDLPSTDPDSYGLRLPTHLRIWQVALDLVEAQIDGFDPSRLESLLERAEEKTGAAIDDGSVRRAVLNGLLQSAQKSLCRFSVTALRGAAIPIQVFGAGWTRSEGGDGTALTRKRQMEISREVGAIIHLDLTGTRIEDALLIAGTGALLLARSTPADREPGGLATLLEPGEQYLPFRTGRDLTTLVQRLSSEPEQCSLIRFKAWERCQRDHTPIQRLRALDAILSS